MKVIIVCDSAGFCLKAPIINYFSDNKIEYYDGGSYDESSVDYTDYALLAAEAVRSGEYDRGILLCGTGIGMSIAANKVKGIRAAVCNDLFSAVATSAHNNTNVLCVGGRVVSPDTAVQIVDLWLNTAFEGGRHQRRIDKITDIEAKYFT